jgi:hypothetical protein
MEDGSESKASIGLGAVWHQWGADTARLGQTVDLIEALATAAAEHMPESEM